MALTIHVFGSTKGESILLALPDGTWGVVDCYTRSAKDTSKNLLLQFLHEKNVQRLSFVCMTHAHEDHFLGIRQLLDEMQVDEFWHPAIMSGDRLKEILKAIIVDKHGEEQRTGRNTNEAELAHLWGKIRSASKKNELCVQRFSLGHVCVPSEAERGFTIGAIGPSDKQSRRFEDRLTSCFDTDGTFKARIKHRDVNLSSAGLLLSYGESRILLGGDIEDGGWIDLISERPFMPESVQFVKVAHHGSPNGYCNGLWGIHTKHGRNTIAVLTPYKRFDLPKMDPVVHILHNGCELYCAGKQEVHRFVTSPIEALSKLIAGGSKPSGDEGCFTITFDDSGNHSDLSLSGTAHRLEIND